MGKLILLALIVLAAVLVWKAFGPASWNQNRQANSVNRPAIKGPDDDEEFLWNIEKNRFKERRRQEQERQQRHDEQQREENQQHQGRDRGTSDRRSDVGDQTDPNTHGAQDSRNTNSQDGSLDRDQPTNSDTPRNDEKTDDQ
ncbi:hypothetical protein NLL32_10700 [Corynebacterium propinquum]|uniref:Secreted protein n=1 Tax=Corynebacterium propinquum TaxID=43769 RepID=A0ABT7G5U6_9CORY|nr:hypothetical protein [Corynebacterium propinquum]MDK4301557.1 hypothetical protein [Corynebacterium propinquum]MDK4314392.1 hypothetical protein [Corynebacterium propinquum]WKS49158.1 hypothetical protein NLL32_10700 [Corynebacterium propinquum]